MTRHWSSPVLAYIGLVLAMMLWASSFVALKLAFRGYDPMVVIFGRMVVASICFAPFIPTFRSAMPFLRQDFRPLLFMAFCEPCLYFLFEARAMLLTTASQAGMITAILPLMVAVGARVVLGEILTVRTMVGFGVAIVGACWLSVAGQPSMDAPNPLLGNFLEFMAMVCATGYIISLKHLTARYSPFFLTAVQAFVGAVFFFPFLFLPSTASPKGFDLIPALAIVYLGAVVTLGAYGLYNYGVSRIPVSRASIFINLIPVFSVLLGAFLLDERFSFFQYVASGLVFIGIYLSQYGGRLRDSVN
ncbi:MAG: DMT family transporter [Deltaproteobacteria bacterium]|jgi:drug/metabolite transporter (DMT)-like permease|nr:DMT family transporter [Deltaproteobacteria bacterium]